MGFGRFDTRRNIGVGGPDVRNAGKETRGSASGS